MEKLLVVLRGVICFLIISCLFDVGISITQKSQDGTQQWGYVQVRPKAHMFWWHYKSPFRVKDASKPWPTILWLQGGPGGSGVGIGNFLEIGPLDTNLNPRNSTWLQKADLLFVDNPVGTGFSYVEESGEFAKGDWEAAADMTTLLAEVSKNDIVGLQNTPFYIFAESYGGKFAVTLALSLLRAVQSRTINLNLRGVALGDSWMSPEDYTFSWGPLLKDLSRISSVALETSNSLALKINEEIKNEKYENATQTWSDLEGFIFAASNGVDFYNFMLDDDMDPLLATRTNVESMTVKEIKGYSGYLSSQIHKLPGNEQRVDLNTFMNDPIKNKLKIIPPNVKWGDQSGSVFQFLTGDFMRPRIKEVDELLAKGVNVTVYNGQVDLICSTKGTEAWIDKLKWKGLTSFKNKTRSPLFCGNEKHTKGFTKSHKNFQFYWILGAGHFVPVDQPCVTLEMVAAITQSPAS